MRIRIVKRPSGRIDGVPLERFEPGVAYDVTASIGTYLMATGYAQAVTETSTAPADRLERAEAGDRPVSPPTAHRESAHERERKKR